MDTHNQKQISVKGLLKSAGSLPGVALVTIALAITASCTKVAVPEEYTTLEFAGITSANVDTSGSAVNLAWTPPVAGGGKAKSSGVGYTVYMMNMTGLVDDSNLDGRSSVNTKVSDEKRLPRFAGKNIAYVKDATEYSLRALDAELEVGGVYAFQVVATASGQTINEHGSIALLKFDSGTDGYSLEVLSGNFQTVRAGQQIAENIVVRLLKNNKPLAGESIAFSIAAGLGSITSATALTNTRGEATTSFVAGSTPGLVNIKAKWRDGYKTTSLTLQTIANQDEYSLLITQGNFQTIRTSTAAATNLTVKLLKAGSPFAGELINFSILTGGGSITSAAVITDASGVASVGYTAGPDAVTATIKADWNSGTKTAEFTQFITAQVDARTIVIQDGNFQYGGIGVNFDTPLKVQVLDGATPQAGHTVTWSVTKTPASSTGHTVTASSVTGALGDATAIFRSGNISGTYEVTASAFGGDKTVKFTFIAAQNAATSKILKIVQAGVGAQPEVNTESLDVAGGTLNLKAALYDMAGTTWLSDVPANWTVIGGGFGASDFSTSISARTNVTFDPNLTGSTIIQATYAGADDPSIVGVTDQTGTVTVTSSLIPAVIAVTGGNGQSGIVNAILDTPFTVKVTNAAGAPVPGEQISFSTVQGNGVITTASIVATNGAGEATATARLGTVVGANIFRATVVSNTAIKIDFNATGVVGPATKLAWGTAPAGAFELVPFNTQPTVTIRDAFDNLVSNAQFDVILEKVSGTGDFMAGSVLTRTSVNGVVTYTGLGWSAISAVTTIRAKVAGDALTSVISTAFSVAGLSSRCAAETARWKTETGGCKDTTTGLVWSGLQATNTRWSNAVWDSVTAGSSAPEAMHNGQTGEGGGFYGDQTSTTDQLSTAICKDLTLGGYNDWYLPTEGDLSTAYSAGLATQQNLSGKFLYAYGAKGSSGNGFATFNMTAGATQVPDSWSASPGEAIANVICVRGQASERFKAPAKIVWTLGAGATLSSGATADIYAQVLDSNNQPVNYAGKTITISKVSGSPNFATAVRTFTVAAGYYYTPHAVVAHGRSVVRLNYSSGFLTGDGAAVLRLTSQDGFTSSTDSTFTVRGANGCDFNDTAAWTTADGGCKDMVSGLVWSRPGGNMRADQVSWDDPGKTDVNDNGWTTDLEFAGWDVTSTAYCHDLTQGGYNDWYLPSSAQLSSARTNGIYGTAQAFNGATNLGSTAYASSTAAGGQMAVVALATGTLTGANNNASVAAICVRGNSSSRFPPATKISATTVPTSIIANQVFSIVAQVQSAGNSNVFMKSRNFTISKETGSGSLTLSSGSFTVASSGTGSITFSNLLYSGTDNFSLRIEGEGLTPLVTASIRSLPYVGACQQNDDASFTTADGGCKDMNNGLVWSMPTTSQRTWGQAIWDAYYAGSSPADANDGGWTNELTVGAAGVCGSNGLACDYDAAAYCHDLTEAGYSDWRTPSVAEYTSSRANGIATRLNWGSSQYHARESTANTGRVFRMSDGTDSNSSGSATQYNSVCVRGVARSAPTKIIGLPTFAHCKVNTNCLFPVTLQVASANGNAINREGVTISLVVTSGSGALSGTFSGVTNRSGQVTLQNFSYSVAEAATISTTNNGGFANASSMALNVTPFEGGCLMDNPGTFTSLNGGCRHDSTGFVYSSVSDTTMTWGEAVWDSTYAGSAAQDTHDGTRTFDYDTSATYTGTDNSTQSYCHALNQGGYQDWRLPTYYEAGFLNNSYVAGIGGVAATSTLYLWTGKYSNSTVTPANFLKFVRNHQTNGFGADSAYSAGGAGSATQSVNRTICVRGP